MKKILIIGAIFLGVSPFLITALVLSGKGGAGTYQNYTEKAYVAIEADGKIAVIDTAGEKVIKSINVSDTQNNKFVKYTIHNVQVAPNGKLVLATANVERATMGESGDVLQEVSDGLFDKIFFIDPVTDTLIGSLALEIDSHLAHVVINKEGTLAYVAAQEKNVIYIVDLQTKKLIEHISLGDNSGPHGLRLSPDGSKLYIALMDGNAIAELTIKDYSLVKYPTSGKVVQVAVTPDGNYIFGTVYDTKKVAWIKASTNEQGYIDLPEDSKGSVQLYATPDSKYIYVVNQGYYFEQPTGNTVYQIDIDKKTVEQTIGVGDAPHGIVIDKNGKSAYVTNLLSDDVSIISLDTNKEIRRIRVGEMPNGISIWNKDMGGTP